ncbi:MAG: FixH family protein [Pirellulaceae bacterium]
MLAVAIVVQGGCQTPPQKPATAGVTVTFNPLPLSVGDAQVTVTLTDESQAVSGATVEVEGNMNHAGMKPTFATLTEVAPGSYRGTLSFTMAGDWFVLVNVVEANGKRWTHSIEVPGVRVP